MASSAPNVTVHVPLPKEGGYDPYDLQSIQRYMGELMAMLKRYMLIHTSHPDRFFEIVVQQRFSRLPGGLEADLLEQPEVLQSAIDEITTLCNAFKEEFSARGARLQQYASVATAASDAKSSAKSEDDDGGTTEKENLQDDDGHTTEKEKLPLTYEELPTISRNGPTRDGPLKAFFEATERLKMGRRHVDYPQPAQTLFPDRAGAGDAQQQQPQPLAAAEDDERVRIRAALLGKGMCTKKKHEVSIMDDAIRDVLAATRAATGNEALTVMNVGEGKGYVSRVLSICEGTPVIGIDCNPLHKEVALERLEPLLDVASANIQSKQSKQILNLNYCARGRTTCVTCRVGPDTDWVGVLRGSVPICNEAGELIEGMSAAANNAADDDNAFSSGPAGGAASPSSPSGPNLQLGTGFQSKVVCTACPKILRCHSGALLVKHARQHSDHVAYKRKQMMEQQQQQSASGGDAVESSTATTIKIHDAEIAFTHLTEWAAVLTPEQLAAKVQEELFTPFVDPSAAKRARAAGEAPEEGQSGAGDATAEASERPTAARRCEFFRAHDFVVKEMMDVVPPKIGGGGHNPKKGQQQQQEKGDGAPEEGEATATAVVSPCTPAAAAEEPAKPQEEVTRRLTIVGYDDNTQRYKAFAHDGDATLRQRNGIAAGKNVMAKLDGPNVLSVEPVVPLQPIVHPITVPSLSSVVLMGLHTCGDLGSAICRLYRETDAPAMVLVSCCWHALTPDGFPMSSMLRNDPQFATNSLSLMLATQPLESLLNSSGEDHYGSSRLLFYRSMFALVWEDLRVQCTPKEAASATTGTSSPSPPITPYDFAKFRPVLERSFLRALAKDKYTMSFVEFCRRIRDVLMKADGFVEKAAGALSRHVAAEDVPSVEASARQKLNAYLFESAGGDGSSDSPYMRMAAECERNYFDQYYAAFVGFTTLRLWMSHLLEALLLIDRVLYLAETAVARNDPTHCERLSLVPLFDGGLSPRLFAILGLKEPKQKKSID